MYEYYEISIHDVDAFQVLEFSDMSTAREVYDRLEFFFAKQAIKLEVNLYHYERDTETDEIINCRKLT
jgi:hypothetical protein